MERPAGALPGPQQKRYQEAAGLDTLGTALTALQSDIRELQNAYALHQADKD